MANGGWRECSNWLTRCGAIRADHKVNWPESTVDDLAHTLRDGVILCNLLKILEPGCLGSKDINQKPQMAQFLCLRNIKMFLQVCQEVFDIKEYDMFDPVVLFELSDFFKVIRTLSILSQTPKLQRLHVPGFIVTKPRTLSQEDIYRNINSLDLVSSRSALLDSFHENEYTSYDTHIRNEEIYHDLCAIDNNCSSISISEHPVIAQQTIEKRDYVINELVETEKNYVDVLQTLLKCFIKPLSKIMKEDDFFTIFQGIKELYEVHKDFHHDLIKACSPYSTLRLSDVFLNWKDKFLVYADYCSNLTIAQDRIQDVCSQNEHIYREVNRCQEEANNGKFKLRDILSVPMQRILKYHLLLDKLIHDTPQTHKDLPGLEWAKECMVDVAQYINEVKRDSDTLQIMNDVQKSIVDWDVVGITPLKNYGHLIADGELKIKSHNDQKVKPRYVFIFDQVVLMCKSIRFIGFQSDQYSFKQLLIISQYRLEDYTTRKLLSRDNRWSHQFNMVHKSEGTTYTFYARSEDQKMKWMKAIQDAMDNNEPSVCNLTSHKFIMHSFDTPTVCYHCSKYLKGCIFQGYKCKECFISVHKLCIPESGRCGLISPQSTTTHNTMFPNRFPNNFDRHRSHDWSDNDTLTEHLWFVGEMDRDRATNLLESESDGTYLVRIRPQGPTRPVETVYALSLKSNNQVKHMKICERLEDGISSFYLSEKRFFPNLVELVNFYERNSLSENFTGLDIKLKWPFCRILAVAKYNFSPTEPNQLPLKEGCTLKILSKEGDQKGWWKGQIGDKIGFFPKVYVQEMASTH